MKLLSFGKHAINLDLVVEIVDRDHAGVDVYFLAANDEGKSTPRTFTGDEADALRAWVGKNAKDPVKKLPSRNMGSHGGS